MSSGPSSVLLLVTAAGPLTLFDYFNYFSATLNQNDSQYLCVYVCIYVLGWPERSFGFHYILWKNSN